MESLAARDLPCGKTMKKTHTSHIICTVAHTPAVNTHAVSCVFYINLPQVFYIVYNSNIVQQQLLYAPTVIL